MSALHQTTSCTALLSYFVIYVSEKAIKQPGAVIYLNDGSIFTLCPYPTSYRSTPSREVHNKLEKNRRAHLKECFETLRRQLPSMDDKKTSNQTILKAAHKHIQVISDLDNLSLPPEV